MGWDGTCTFEERVDGHWYSLAECDIQNLVYRVNGSLHASFVANDSMEREDFDNGTFLWRDFIAASDDDLEGGRFRNADEVLKRLRKLGDELLVSALTDDTRTVRVVCVISC